MFRLRRWCGLNLSKSKLRSATEDTMLTVGNDGRARKFNGQVCVRHRTGAHCVRILAHICLCTCDLHIFLAQVRRISKEFRFISTATAVIVDDIAFGSFQTCSNDSINHNHSNVHMVFSLLKTPSEVSERRRTTYARVGFKRQTNRINVYNHSF